MKFLFILILILFIGCDNQSNDTDIDDDKSYEIFVTLQDLDYIADKVSIIPEHKRGLLDIFKSAVYKKPSLVIDVLKVFAGV